VRFARSLVETGLIDEYHLVIHPVVLGADERICTAPLTSEPTSTIVFSGGAVAHVFKAQPDAGISAVRELSANSAKLDCKTTREVPQETAAGPDDVYFESRRDRPWGAFSNYEPSPIVLDSGSFATVEHWYQAQRPTDPDERLRVATAVTPEEAKALSHAVRTARSDWDRVKLGVMYRGLLAKFRQHPALGALLLGTGERGIHETGTDPFWTIADGTGADWLGRLLMTIRDELRAGTIGLVRDPEVRAGLSGTFSVGYQIAAGIRESLDEEGAWFTHVIREGVGGPPAPSVLEQILRGGRLLPRELPGGGSGVCFTSAGLERLRKRCFGVEADLRRQHSVRTLSGWGVAIPYHLGRELGLRPVLSVASRDVAALPDRLRWLVQPFGSDEQRDWTYEDEWRSEHAVELRPDLMRVLVPREAELERLPAVAMHGWTATFLAPGPG
jgi:N-glycosidase YbiA